MSLESRRKSAQWRGSQSTFQRERDMRIAQPKTRPFGRRSRRAWEERFDRRGRLGLEGSVGLVFVVDTNLLRKGPYTVRNRGKASTGRRCVLRIPEHSTGSRSGSRWQTAFRLVFRVRSAIGGAAFREVRGFRAAQRRRCHCFCTAVERVYGGTKDRGKRVEGVSLVNI